MAQATAVPVGNLRPEILVMQPAQNRDRQRATDSLDDQRWVTTFWIDIGLREQSE